MDHPLPEPDTARKVQRRGPRRGRSGIGFLVTMIAVLFGLAFGVMALSGRTIQLPVWAVAEAEARLNAAVLPGSGLPAGSALSVGAIAVTVARDWVPRFRLQDLRLLHPGGSARVTLPEVLVALDPGPLVRGRVQPTALRISGARLGGRRAADGQFDFAFGASEAEHRRFADGAAVMDAIDRVFASPPFASLRLIEAEALTLQLDDAIAGRTWDVGDGRLVIENADSAVTAQLSLSLLGGAQAAQAVITLTTDKASSAAQVAATFEGVAAADLAALAPPLAFLQVIAAPLSGRIETALSPDGRVSGFDGALTLGKGALQPSPSARPVEFDRAELALGFDPAAARISLRNLVLVSPSMRLSASGQGYLLDAAGKPMQPGGQPASLLAQLAMTDVIFDPAGLFAQPVRFSGGAMDLRLTLRPFRLDLGQLSLTEGSERLLLKGTVSTEPGGWTAALDVGLNRIKTGRLMTLWPVNAVPRTREWLVANVQEGELFDVNAALRLAPGQEPRLSLGYEFANTDVRFLKTLPPIRGGYGHASMEGTVYTLVLDKGHVTPPEGGQIDVAGSVFQVPDIGGRPARASITLQTDSSLTAVLSLLDQPPFRFLSKAGQRVDLGQGHARLKAVLDLPLINNAPIAQITYGATGTIRDFSTDKLIPGRLLTAPELEVRLSRDGLDLQGAGLLGRLPFDVTYSQGFGPDQKGRSRVEGTVALSDAALREVGIELPAGAVAGEGQGQVAVELVKGQPARLSLQSDLNRLTLRLDALGWNKPAATRGRLDIEAVLGPQPEVRRLSLEAPGLKVTGRLTTRAGGGLDVARFDTVQAGEWLDAEVDLIGRGKGQPVDIAVTAGSLDLRRMPERDSGAKGAGSPFTLRLDEVIVTSALRLTRFRGDFSPVGGLNGGFTALVNARGPVRGTVVPGQAGTAVRLLSDDAGAVMAAAGIMEQGKGGTLDLRLQPRGRPGQFIGRAEFQDLRVRDAPVLAELLSAVSVVGLLEQLNGNGLLFSDGEVDFILTPAAVQITQGSAVGLSLGISMAGLYRTDTKRLDLQGVVSPIYLLNGIGALFTRRGEGLFGFNYRMSGPVNNPDVSVNPLSILSPGRFREIFRRAPPSLKDSG